ncbi:hypothetical protein FBU30_008305 [Linnemannia zychae]|nr:hypothetical protein FBU30_008305 [Linnemannia zychae]
MILGFAQVCIAQNWYWIFIFNNDGSKNTALYSHLDNRVCYCLVDTQTAKIDGRPGGTVKLFSTSDCTGNWSSGSGKITYNAQWVNSVSIGVADKPSNWDGGKTCKWY